MYRGKERGVTPVFFKLVNSVLNYLVAAFFEGAAPQEA
jgi:hypothetical protein